MSPHRALFKNLSMAVILKGFKFFHNKEGEVYIGHRVALGQDEDQIRLEALLTQAEGAGFSLKEFMELDHSGNSDKGFTIFYDEDHEQLYLKWFTKPNKAQILLYEEWEKEKLADKEKADARKREIQVARLRKEAQALGYDLMEKDLV